MLNRGASRRLEVFGNFDRPDVFCIEPGDNDFVVERVGDEAVHVSGLGVAVFVGEGPVEDYDPVDVELSPTGGDETFAKHIRVVLYAVFVQ